MDGATLYSKWQLAAAEAADVEMDPWELIDEGEQRAWEQFATNLNLDYSFPSD